MNVLTVMLGVLSLDLAGSVHNLQGRLDRAKDGQAAAEVELSLSQEEFAKAEGITKAIHHGITFCREQHLRPKAILAVFSGNSVKFRGTCTGDVDA